MKYFFSAIALTLSLLCATTSATWAQPSDALTEASTRADKVQEGVAFTARSKHRCTLSKRRPTTSVSCRRGGYVGLQYEFTVPRKAINMRVRVDRDESFTGKNYRFAVDSLWRTSARHVSLWVTASGRVNLDVHAVKLVYDLPTKYDKRSCVTPGEWARINMWRGGFGGTLKQVASVFDTSGRLTYLSDESDGFQYQLRKYNKCGSSKRYRLTFHHNDGYPGWYSYWG